ncbi:MAG: hypothetical protein HYY20_10795 [Candidatus Tectomicrobia bacterium]|uniref:Uncharacterized protein n=1 Tax=Tectimicrobiota bacterium TaxID=2528274 RepID=A0A932CQ00_UNCTE|nr:hypothetical protein [Candidatus Tectomicrobia bacterium]
MAQVMMKINILADGTLEVVDTAGNQISPQPGPGNSMQGKTMKSIYQLNIMISSNPCGWVEIDGRWYWMCW